MKSTIGRVLAFCIGLVLLLAISSLLLLPKETTAEAGFLEPEADAVLAEPEDTLDVAFLGNSTVLYGVRPLRIWRDTGITSYNCGTNAQKLYQAEEYLSTVLRQQSPKLVMLEIDILFTPQTELEVADSYAERIFPVLRYHDRWKTAQLEDLFAPVQYTVRQKERGYVRHDGVAGYVWPIDLSEKEDLAPLGSSNLRSIRRIAAQCQEENVQLVFLSVPNPDCWDYYRHNTVAALADELGAGFIDLNLLYEDVGIDWNTDTYDYGKHLNSDGAEKVSAYLANYLVQTGLFTDKRADSQYADWSRAAENAA